MITDLEARRIASSWHGGGGTALYALSSTGALPAWTNDNPTEYQTYAEKEAADMHRRAADRPYAYAVQDIEQLSRLLHYVVTNGPRGPVDGWSTLTW